MSNNATQNLISFDEVIRLAKLKGVNFGKGDPYNRLRYYIKIGLLPKASRKSFNGLAPAGALPISAVDQMVEIDKDIKSGKTIQTILRSSKVNESTETYVTTPIITDTKIDEDLGLFPAVAPLTFPQPQVASENLAVVNEVDLTGSNTNPVMGFSPINFFKKKAFNKPKLAILGAESLLLIAGLIFLITQYGQNISQDNNHLVINKDDLPTITNGESGQTLASTVRDGLLSVYVPTNISGLLTTEGGIVTNNTDVNAGTGKLTASNVIYTLTAGTNVSITGGQNAVISATAGSVTGTANRITVSGSQVNIASNYAGQSTITTLGTITTGVWNASPLSDPFVDNTITLDNITQISNRAISDTTGTLTVNRGGTGATTFTTNGVLYGNGTGAVQVTAASTGTQCLQTTSAGVAPTWGACGGGSAITVRETDLVPSLSTETLEFESTTDFAVSDEGGNVTRVVLGTTVTKLGSDIDLASEVTGTLPAGSVGTGLTDAQVLNNITVDNYLPLLGGTLTGSLTLNDDDGVSDDVNIVLGDANESGTITTNNGAINAGTGTGTFGDVFCNTSCITLSSETTGNYVASTNTSVLTGLSGGSAGSEGANLTIGLDYSQALTGDIGLAANAAVFGQSGLVFEGSAADLIETFISITNPTSADKTITVPDASGTIILSGHSFTGGDVTGTLDTDGTTVLTVGLDAVALGTDTTGNYVSSATADAGLVMTGTEGASLGIQLATAGTEAGANFSGLTLDAAGGGNGLRLLNCTNTQILKKTGGNWTCSTDDTGTGSIGGSGTQYTLAMFSNLAGDEVDDSIVSQNSAGTQLSIGSAPNASTILSLLRLGSNAISSGSANGTYLGLNATVGYAGDLINFQVNSVSQFILSASGDITTSGGDIAGASGTNLDIGEATNNAITITESGLETLAFLLPDDGTNGFTGTVTLADLTDNRTYTLPDAGGTFANSGNLGNSLTFASSVFNVRLETADSTSTTAFAPSGLEITSGGLTIIQGCSDGQLLKWDDDQVGGARWECDSDTVGGGGGGENLNTTYGFGSDGGQIITLTSSDDSITIQNPAAGAGTDQDFVLKTENLDAGITTADFKNLWATSAGSFDTTATNLTNYSTYISNTSTESAGGNTLTNVGLYVTASGADSNYAAIFAAGNVGIGTTTPSSLLEIGTTLTNTAVVQDINLTLGDDLDVDIVIGINVDVTSAATGDADFIYGLNLANVTTPDGTVTERALRIGTGWDAGIEFEGSTNDNFEVLLTAADATGSTKTITLPNETGTVCTTGSICSGYVGTSRTLTAGVGLSGGGDLSVNRSFDIDLLDSADGTSGVTNSLSGLEFQGAANDELTLLQGCDNDQILKWDNTNTWWYCTDDAGTAGTVRLDTIVAATISDTNNNSGDFDIAWNWSLTTAAKTAFTITENAASTNGVGNQYIFSAATLASSTAAPFNAIAQGNKIIDTTAAGGVTIGNATAAQAVTIDAGTATLSLGNSNNAKTINIGTGTAVDTINIGTGGAASAESITIGSTDTDSSLILRGGGVNSVIDFSAFDVVGDLASSGNQNQVVLADTIPLLNNGQTFRGIYLNYTNNNHTGTTNDVNLFEVANITGDDESNLNAIKIGNLTGTANTAETAINIGTGWDTGLKIADVGSTKIGIDLQAASLVNGIALNIIGPSGAGSITGGLLFYGASDVGANSAIASLAPTFDDSSGTSYGLIIQATDSTSGTANVNLLDITGFTAANRTGGSTNALKIGNLTSADADVAETAINIGTGWDNSILFATNAAHLIKVQDQATAATAGSNLSITGATGNTSGAGGNITISAGAGGSSGNGGILNLSGGTTTAGTSGYTNVTGSLQALASTNFNPEFVGGLDITTAAVKTYVSGRYAYIVHDNIAGNDLKIIDIGNPASPATVGGVDLGSNGSGIFVAGRYAYLTKANNAGSCSGATLTGCEFSIYDVSTPSSPAAVGGVNLGITGNNLYISGRYAYVTNANVAGTCSGTDLTGCEFRIYDVSNPAAPAAVGGIDFAGVDGARVFVSGRYAYVTRVNAAGNDFITIDISNPFTPTALGGVDLGIDGQAVYVSGRYAYLTNSTVAGTCSGATLTGCEFRVYDITNPASPTAIGGADLGAIGHDLFVAGRYAYIGTSASSWIRVYDVLTPSSPTLVGSTANPGSSVFGVYVSGRYLYATKSNTAGISQDFIAYDITGIETTSLSAHSLEAANIQVRNDIQALGQLQVTGGLDLGWGGLFSAGPAAFGAVNPAGSSLDSVVLSGTLNDFNGSDTFRGLYLNYTNGAEPGAGSNVINAIDIAGITGRTNTAETAINIGTGWDTAIQLTGANTIGATGATTFSSTQTSGFLFTINPTSSVAFGGGITGLYVDLDTDYTAGSKPNKSFLGEGILLPGGISNSDTPITIKGLSVATNGSLTTTAGDTTYTGLDVATPALTETAGTLTAYGIDISTGAAGTGSTLRAVNIGNASGTSTDKIAVNIGTSWDTEIKLNDTSPTIAIGNGTTGVLAFTDGTSTLASIVDNGTYGFVRLSDKGGTGDPADCTAGDVYFNDTDNQFKGCVDGTANTWSSFTDNSGATITLQGAYTNDDDDGTTEILMTATDGPINFQAVAGTNIQINANTSAPTLDLLAISNSGLATITDEANALYINYVSTGAIGNQDYNAVQIDVAGGSTGSSDTTTAINIGDLSGASSGVESAINIGDSWDYGINFGYHISAGSAWTAGTLINNSYSVLNAATQTAAITGVNLDFYTNFDPLAGSSIVGYSIKSPTTATSSGATTFTGFSIATAGGLNNNTAGSIAWYGANISLPTITQGAGGTVTADGIRLTIPASNSITTAGIMNGLNIVAPTTSGPAAGTLTGINIGAITSPGAGATETALNIGSGWDSQISGNGVNLDGSGNLLAVNAATGTTGTTTGTGTDTTTLNLTTDPFSVNDVVFINNAGQDYYTRITVDPGTNSYTVSPAVTFEAGVTVTKYTIQNIGATSTDYTTATNRYFQGYFLGGIVAGAASTIYSDGRIDLPSASNTTLNIGNSGAGVTNLVVDGNITGAATGTVGYWSKGGSCLSSTTICPATAGDAVQINNLTSTRTTGELDIDTSSATDGHSGINLAYTASGGTDRSQVAADITFINSDTSGLENDSYIGLRVTNAATAGTGETKALIQLDNAENTASSVTSGILFSNSGATTGAYDYGIDLSVANAFNVAALKLGANSVVGTTPTIDFTNFDLRGSLNAAGASANHMVLSGTLGAFDDATDTFRGIFLDYTNADHSAAGNFKAIDIDSITDDPQGVETAINIGAGWDDGLKITGTTGQTAQNALDISGYSYQVLAGNTGNLVDLSFTNAATTNLTSSTTNGINISATLNTSGTTTKNTNAINISQPTFTACTAGACNYSAVNINPQDSIANLTQYGVNIGSVGTSTGTDTAINIGSGWDNSINATGFIVEGSAGHTAIGSTAATSADKLLVVGQSSGLSTTARLVGTEISFTSATNNISSLASTLPGAANGLDVLPTFSPTSNNGNRGFIGVLSRPEYNSANTSSALTAFESRPVITTTGITSLLGYYAQSPTFTSTVTNSYGFYANNQGSAGVSSSFGVYVLTQTGSANNYGVYVADASTATILLASNDGDAASGITFGTTNPVTLYRSAADTLKTDDSFNVATGNIDADSAADLNLNNTSTGNVLIAGGSGATGCTVTNSNGNLACSGTITSSGGGAVGYWSRSGTTLSPATANDIIALAQTASTTSLTITNADAFTTSSTSGKGVYLNFNRGYSCAACTLTDTFIGLDLQQQWSGSGASSTFNIGAAYTGHIINAVRNINITDSNDANSGDTVANSSAFFFNDTTTNSDTIRDANFFTIGDCINASCAGTDSQTVFNLVQNYGSASGNLFKATSIQTSGTIANITVPATVTTSGALTALTLDLAGATLGSNNRTALNIPTITGTGGAADTAINIGSGWDDGVSITGTTGLTVQNAIDISGYSFNNTSNGAVSAVAKIAFTDASSINSGVSDTVYSNGLQITPTVNVTSGIGIKNTSGIMIDAPTLTSCSNGNCVYSGLSVSGLTNNGTAAFNQRAISIEGITNGSNTTDYAINVGDGWDRFLSGVFTSITSKTVYGAYIDLPVTNTSGAANAFYADLNAPGSSTTQRGLYITSTGNGGGTLYGVDIGNNGSSGSADAAINIGTSWDYDIALNDTSPVIKTITSSAGNDYSLKIDNTAGTPQNLLELRDLTGNSNNFGSLLLTGAVEGKNSRFTEEFSLYRSGNCSQFSSTAEVTNVQARGDWGYPTTSCTANTGEITTRQQASISDAANGCTFSSNNALNGYERLQATNTGGQVGCMETMTTNTGSTAYNLANPANLPVLSMKARVDLTSTNQRVFLGLSNITSINAKGNPATSDKGIYFTNCSAPNTPTCTTGSWYGAVNDGTNAANVTSACTGTLSTTQFAYFRIEVRKGTSTTSTEIEFFIDPDVSNGIAETSCGTITSTTTAMADPNLTMMLWVRNNGAFTTNLDVDYFRLWQDDALVDTRANTNTESVTGQETVSSAETVETLKNSQEQIKALNKLAEDAGGNLTATLSAQTSFNLTNTLGQVVASISDTGEAVFSSIQVVIGRIQNLIIGGSVTVKKDAQIAGVAKFEAGASEVIVPTPKVKDNSLVYVTVKTKTAGLNLFVKEIKTGESFTVSLEKGTDSEATQSATRAIEFNWLIVDQEN